jgi:hypothetical protein
VYCPPPPTPVCAPGKFDKTLLDTTFHGIGHPQNHITEIPPPFNGDGNEYSIAFIPSGGGLIALMTTDRSNLSSEGEATGVQRMYSARMISTTQYSPLRKVGIPDSMLPVGAGTYCSADGLFYFSAKARNIDPNDYDIFAGKVEIVGDSVAITNIHSLSAINASKFFDSQPALDATGLNIYFISDRTGSSGGTDIWHSSRTSISSQDWSTPEALAPPVNSECDEISPFISPTEPNILYFASNGHETVGGYDLFKTEIRGRSYSEPQNLGKPINSQFDEAFPVRLNDTAFFWASNMPAREHHFNLYTITRTILNPIAGKGKVAEPERPDIGHLHLDTTKQEVTVPEKPAGPVALEVHVTRGATFRPAVGSQVFVRRDSGVLYRGAVPENGAILFKVLPDQQYDVGAESEDAFFDVKHEDLRGIHDTTLRVDLHLPDTLVLRINFPFDDYLHPYDYVIDENGHSLNMTWQQTLDLTAQSLKNQQSKLERLIVIGHTDSLGTDQYNDKLGFRRATFVADQLEARGVPHALLHVASAGRTRPVGRRPDESDEIFRLRSRRVEIVKVYK